MIILTQHEEVTCIFILDKTRFCRKKLLWKKGLNLTFNLTFIALLKCLLFIFDIRTMLFKI